ncbi:phospholipase D family protein [Janthinobacterium sp. PC23-8]|uniref:phospholipase D family protein n=1 Tax=Janthinobacterium sp. PC23-8 TaxID=2012679 RepID=UPI0011408E07|nr:phospholipase D family protein [Janthinobacterium sp. PC23-8]
MTFVFQQPGTTKLLEAIDDAAADATAGGGVFAFASRGGIDAFFSRPNIARMLRRRQRFQLIVGVDAITNAEALLCLSEKVAQYNGILSANVFFHENPASTFHPKFSWFQQGSSLRLVTGSGNLTKRGLGQLAVAAGAPPGNWEAFSIQTMLDGEATSAMADINAWLAGQLEAGTLCSLDDERVRERAMANGRMRFASTTPRVRIPAQPAEALDAIEVAPVDGITFSTPEILVREIPKNRSGQADLGKTVLTEFFGYEGSEKKVFVQFVSLDNIPKPVEPILLFVNQSKNYRLELHEIAALDYDLREDDGRMILVATKLDLRSFRYTILPVTAPDYDTVAQLLGPIPPLRGRSRPMRELFMSSTELRTTWLNVPDNLLPLETFTPEP